MRLALRLVSRAKTKAGKARAKKNLEATYDALAAAQEEAAAHHAEVAEEKRIADAEKEAAVQDALGRVEEQERRQRIEAEESAYAEEQTRGETEAREMNDLVREAQERPWPPAEGEIDRILPPETRLPADMVVESDAFADERIYDLEQDDPSLVLGFSFDDPITGAIAGWMPVPWTLTSWSELFEIMRAIYDAFEIPPNPFRRRRAGEDYTGQPIRGASGGGDRTSGGWRRVA